MRREKQSRLAVEKLSRNEAKIYQYDVEGLLTYSDRFADDLGRQWFDLPPQLCLRFQKLGVDEYYRGGRRSKRLPVARPRKRTPAE